MKKSTKAFIVGLAAIPCALAMTACGGGEDDPRLVDTTGSYRTQSSYSEVLNHMDAKNLSTDLASYRLLVDMSLSTQVGALNTGADIIQDSIIKISDSSDGQKINAKTTTSFKMTQNNATQNISSESYIKDNTMWGKIGTEWVTLGFVPAGAYTSHVFDFENMFGDISATEQAGITVEVDRQDSKGIYKVKMTMDSDLISSFTEGLSSSLLTQYPTISDWGNSTAYYIFENNEFMGATLDINFSTSIAGTTSEGTIKVDIAQYDGDIQFPEFPVVPDDSENEEGERIVDTSGEYITISSFGAVKNNLEEMELSTELSSFRLVSNIEMSAENEGTSVTINIIEDTTAVITGSGQNASIDAKTDASFITTQNGISSEESATQYVQDNTIWAPYEGSWMNAGTVAVADLMAVTLDFNNVFDYLDPQQQAQITVNAEINESTGTYKVKMTMSSELIQSFAQSITESLEEAGYIVSVWGDACLYYIFENNQFVGASLDMSLTIDADGLEIPTTVKIDFASFDGTIDFPAALA